MKSAIAMTLTVCLGMFFVGTPALAEHVSWELVGVTFEEGGIVEGTFYYDTVTGDVFNVALSVSGGNEIDFPPTTYTDEHYLECYYNWAPECTFMFEMAANRQLRLTFVEPLVAGGGTVAVDTQTEYDSGSVECYNCNPWRIIVSGSIVGVTVANESLAWSAVKAMYK